jgi:ABC-2 type transport system ATP-binding protein
LKKQNIIIEVRDLVKSYSSVQAVNGISFDVLEGEIFGMVGPNGAGKTTTIECIEGLRHPDAGLVKVLGLDPRRNGFALREKIGIQLQESALPDRITVWETMDMFASFYPKTVDGNDLLEQLGLIKKRKTAFTKLSGGQKQRLFIALALINDPEVVFLDELTTGLDPKARRSIWDLVLGIRDRGKTVFLTTHFMEEAERLCNRVAIMDQARIVALDTPSNLITSLSSEYRVVFNVQERLDAARFQKIQAVSRIEQVDEQVTVYGREEGLLIGIVNALEEGKIHYRSLRTEQPTLEDVFLAMTGKQMQES